MDLIDVSIIIVNFRGWKDLQECLFALESFENEHFSFEVIVVDNCSNDDRLAEFAAGFPHFSFILNSGNNGFSNGCNLGAAHAHGTYLLFLNPDIIATGDAVLGLLQTIQIHPEIVLLSCKQVDIKGREEQSIRLFPSFLTMNGIVRSIYRKVSQIMLASSKSENDGIIYPEWVSGSVILVANEKFKKLGRWDDRYWLYYEDVDLCYRAQLSGGKVALNNQIKMIHHHGGATRINIQTKALTKSEVIISLHVFLSTHCSEIQAFVLHLIVVSEVLLFRLIPAVLGLIFFFVKRLHVYTMVYGLLLDYYFRALQKGSWLSRRSVKYKW